MSVQPKIAAIAPWFGSNRMLGHEVGKLLEGCKWVGVPFGGGLSEFAHIKAKSIVVSDKHHHVMNLARAIQNRQRCIALVGRLMDAPFHEAEHKACQDRCRMWQERIDQYGFQWDDLSESAIVDWAYEYFVACWMGRSHISGTKDEFCGKISARWNANGGDSNVRYRNAVRSLAAWSGIMKRCNFRVMDAFDFIGKCHDEHGNGIYCDPPFPGPGDDYRHTFGESGHRKLAEAVGRFESTRVVMRFYDHPLIRELYPEDAWKWIRFEGRTQANTKPSEVLICRLPRSDSVLF